MLKSILPKNKIRNKLLSGFIILSLIPLLIVGLISFFITEKQLKNSTKVYLEKISEDCGEKISFYMDNQYKKIIMISSGGIFLSDDIDIIQTRIEQILSSNPDYEAISIIDINGIIIACTQKELIGDLRADREWFKKTIKCQSGEVIPIDVYRAETANWKRVVGFNAPIYDRKKENIVRVITIRLSMEDIIIWVNELDENASGINHAYLLNSRGEIIAGPDEEEFLTTYRLYDYSIVQSLLDGKSEITEYKNDRGEKIVGATYSLIGKGDFDGWGWGIIVNQKASVAYGAAFLIRNLTIILFIIIAIIVIIFALIISRNIANPIKIVSEKALKISNGDFKLEKIEVRQNDEIGNLITSFNIMTEKLYKTTVSKNNLETEINERKKIEEKLRESEETFRAISSSTHDAMVMIDNRGNISFWNEAAEKIFGYSFDEVKDKNLHSLLVPERFKEAHNKVFPHFQKTGKGAAVGKTLELAAIRKDGVEIPVELSLSAIKLHGEWNAVGIMRDISERKKAEEKLKTTNKELSESIKKTKILSVKADEANTAKSQFLANMSHEIRTPMNAVIGFTDILLDTKMTENQIDYANTIKSSGESLLILINSILDFSKIEARELTFDKIDFDPELLAYDVCDIIKPKIGTKPIEILCHIGSYIPAMVKGDPGRFRQVLTNLMSNASKFTDSGEIELCLDVDEENENRIKLHAIIRDTGIGIPENKLSDIFIPFQQADGSTTRKYGGTGLGLSICKQISELMEGDVWVESKIGKGSTFHFTAWLEKTEDKEFRKFLPTSLSNKKILIVDDNQTNLDILLHVLELVDIKVFALKQGRKVLPVLQKAFQNNKPFDLCIIDIQMPDLDGYEVAKTIRLWEEGKKGKELYYNIPLIALSSLMDRDAKKCEEVGFSAFLSKPLRREKLYRVLERLISETEEEKDIKNHKIVTQYSAREEMKHSVNILLVEDNPANQKLAELILKKAGYHVKIANNGLEAFELFTSTPENFDLILMDVQMPKMDGFEATRKIRESGFNKIPIVAMTAYALKGDEDKCLDAGMNDYITKPIKRELVYQVINKWIFNKEN